MLYFKLPLKADRLITNKGHDKCDLKESIAGHIHLITTTYFGECGFDETYGCSIWDIDFDNLSNTNRIKEAIAISLLESLKRHEKRLHKVSIEVKIKQEEIISSSKNLLVKKKVTIRVKGSVRKTSEAFFYEEFFYIGPLSY